MTLLLTLRRIRYNTRLRNFCKEILRSPSQRKHVVRWLRSQKAGYCLENEVPWISFDATQFLKKKLFEQATVFEYGSGGSTAFWLKNGANVVSIEHNQGWYELVSQRLEPHPNLSYRFSAPTPLPHAEYNRNDASDPTHYSTEDKELLSYSFESYVKEIDAFPDSYFDFVLVDGRSRPACVVHSIPKVKVGGMLILDNSDRAYYLEKTQHLLRDFQTIPFVGVTPEVQVMTKTTIYLKKK